MNPGGLPFGSNGSGIGNGNGLGFGFTGGFFGSGDGAPGPFGVGVAPGSLIGPRLMPPVMVWSWWRSIVVWFGFDMRARSASRVPTIGAYAIARLRVRFVHCDRRDLGCNRSRVRADSLARA
jgi:hypothetical protein